MGSKTFDGRNDYQDGDNTKVPKSNGASGRPRGAHLAEDGDGEFGNGDDDDDDDNNNNNNNNINNNHGVGDAGGFVKSAPVGDECQKKKRKKSKKNKNKKKRNGAAAVTADSLPLKQSSPPRVLLSNLFPSNVYPTGELADYGHGKDENTARTTGEEIRHLTNIDIEDDEFLNNYRKAAEVHRQVRSWVQETVRPGQTLTEIAEGIEDGVRALLGNQGLEPGDGLKSGIGFPTGLALNDCAAHFTPNAGQKEIVLQQEDVMKVDFGVHVNGWIVDSAFTMAFDPVYDNLLAAVKDATNTGIKHAGIDAQMGEIGAAIQEAMESYEVEIKGKTIPVKAVRSITGHNIRHYRIHGSKHIPFVKTKDTTRMEEGEVFAIETFGTTGKGYLKDDVGAYGYGKAYDAPRVPLSLGSARSLLKTINENFGTLVFCRRYLDRLGVEKYLYGLNSLVSSGLVNFYAPLVDIKGSHVAQFEHTILLRHNCKEVISRGDDY